MQELVTARPACRPNLVIRPLGDGGRYVIKDPLAGAFFTFGEQECFLLGQLDGRQDAAAVCQAFQERFGEPLSEEELGEFIGLVRARGFLLPDGATVPRPEEGSPPAPAAPPPAPAARPERAAPAADAPAPPPRPRQSILYWRMSLFDPDRLFTWLAPRLGFLWTGAFLFASAGGIVFAAALAWANHQELVSNFAHAWRWQTALLIWLTLIVATTLHEFAHGLTCKHHGGEVHEVGFLLLFFLPCFYCNVSDAWLFREKSKRLWVTLAGGYCDLCTWALAVFVWRLSPLDGLVNYLAWVALSVLGARIFFNCNPLIKLDGYYLLSDALEIYNLRQRAWERVAGWLRWLLWGAERPARERWGRFLLVYGLLSRLYAPAFLVLMLIGLYHLLGAGWVGAGCTVLLGAMTLPRMFRGFGGEEFRNMIRLRHKRTVVWALLPGAAAATLFLGQMEDRASGPFQVRPAVRAELRAPVAGFLRCAYFDEGDRVSPGAVVCQLEIPDLDSQLAQKRAAVREAQARLRLLEAGTRPEEVHEQRQRVRRAGAWRDLAQQDLRQARQALREELAQLEKQIVLYGAELEYAQDVLGRSRQLFARRSISEEQYRESEKQVQVAQARKAQAQAQERARRALGTQEAEKELARREKELADARGVLVLLEAGPRPEEVEAERARLARLHEEARYLEGLQHKLPVSSPVPGRITTPYLKEKAGQYFREGELICQVEGPCNLEVEITLGEQEAARVLPGQAVTLKARVLPFQTLDTWVDRVAPTAAHPPASPLAQNPVPTEAPGTVTIYCRLEGVPDELRAGMTGYARIWCGRRRIGEVLAERVLRYLRTEFWW